MMSSLAPPPRVADCAEPRRRSMSSASSAAGGYSGTSASSCRSKYSRSKYSRGKYSHSKRGHSEYLHGICMVYMHGICMVYAWYMLGICMVYACLRGEGRRIGHDMVLHELVQLKEGALLREQREQRAAHLAVGRQRVLLLRVHVLGDGRDEVPA
jgi:hypothetical protein